MKSLRTRPGNPGRNGIVRHITAIALMIAIPALHAAAEPSRDAVRTMLREVTGITEDDIRSAREARELALFDAYALAVFNTEVMAIEGEHSVQARLRKEQAITSFLPTLSLRANKSYPEMKERYVSASRSMVSLVARLPVMTGLDEASRIASSSAEVKMRRMELHDAAGRLLVDVAAAFYDALRIEESLRNSEEMLGLHERMLRELERRVAIGRSRRSDVLRTRAQMYRLEADITSLKNGLAHARVVLENLLGPRDKYALKEGTEPPPPGFTAGDADSLAEKRWDVKAARERIDYARAGVLSALGLHLPSAYIEGGYMLYQEKADAPRWERALQAYRSPTSLLTPTRYRDHYVSLGVEVPLLGPDVTFAKTREARSVKRQADLGLSMAIRLARQDIIDAYQTWESSQKELEAFRRALEAAEQNNRTVSAEYRMNLVTILDVLTSLTSLQDAKDDYRRALLQHRLDRIRLGVAANEWHGGTTAVLKNPGAGAAGE